MDGDFPGLQLNVDRPPSDSAPGTVWFKTFASSFSLSVYVNGPGDANQECTACRHFRRRHRQLPAMPVTAIEGVNGR